jgi:hypothetical protein
MSSKDTFSIISLVICTVLFFVGLILYLVINTGMAGPAVIGLSVYGFLLIAISMLLKSMTRLEERLVELSEAISKSAKKGTDG